MNITRREVITWIGFGASALSLRAAAAAPSSPTEAPQWSAAGTVFQGLAVGNSLAGRWTVTEVHPEIAGAVPVFFSGEGGSFRLNVMRRDVGGVPGVGNSSSLSVYVCNSGGGQTQTVEDHGQAAMALAAWLEAQEQAGLRVPKLATMRERSR